MTDFKYYYTNKIVKGYRGSRLLVTSFSGREITDLIIAKNEPGRPSGPVPTCSSRVYLNFIQYWNLRTVRSKSCWATGDKETDYWV